MLKHNLVLASASALASSLLAAPIAADLIAYRTEDGVFVYTDDPHNVPARYAADAVTMHDTALHAYPRLTLEDSNATRAVESRLEKRLDYLRQMNATSAAQRAVGATPAQKSTVISIPTGAPGVFGSVGKNGKIGKIGDVIASPSIEVSANAGNEPIVVEPILTRESDRAITRSTTVVKQGDKILAVMKGRSHEFDVNSDIYDEDALAEQR
jgi:hypothetical protein